MHKYRPCHIKLLAIAGVVSVAISGCNTTTETPSDNTSVDTIVSENVSENEESSEKDSEVETDTLEESEEQTNDEIPEIPFEETEDKLTDTQQNSMNMLNHLTVLTQEINASKNSKLYLEEAYSSIVNNYNPNAIDDRTLGELNALLDTLEDYRMVDEKRDRLEYIYEQNQAQAVRDAVPNPLGLLGAVQSFSLPKLVASVAYMAVDSATSYQSSSAQADLQYLQDGWALDDEQASVLHNQRKGTFSYMVKTVNENQLPGELALTEESVEEFVKWKNNKNVVSRIQFLESNQDTYSAYGGYWLTLAESYYENGDYQKCLDAIKAYEDLEICIFRKNCDYAEKLPLAIASAEEVLEDTDYISNAERYAENIISNAKNEQWALRYFAAQTYIDLYAKTNNEMYLKSAYNIALDNVNNLISKQHDMNATYLSEIVEAEAKKGATSEAKDEIKKYNKMLKEERKTELPPIYEPLKLNCDLLFSLAEKMDISEDDKKQIEHILHENDEPLFLVEEIDNLYRFSAKNIDASKIEISFDGEEIIILAKYVAENAKITMSVKSKNKTTTIDDWIVDEVDRDKKGKLNTFKVVYTSKSAKDFKYGKKMDITIKIEPQAESKAQTLTFKYDTVIEKRWGIIPDKLTYKRK